VDLAAWIPAFHLEAEIMSDGEFPTFVINQVVFDHIAAMEGQVRDGFKIHSVDRVAGTLRFGATLFKAIKLIPMEIGQIDRLQIIESTPEEFALKNKAVQLNTVYTMAPRGAQWKRESNRHRVGK
jgi:hypothetical protein